MGRGGVGRGEVGVGLHVRKAEQGLVSRGMAWCGEGCWRGGAVRSTDDCRRCDGSL